MKDMHRYRDVRDVVKHFKVPEWCKTGGISLRIKGMQLFARPMSRAVIGVALRAVTQKVFQLTKTRGMQNAFRARLKKERRKKRPTGRVSVSVI